LKSYTTGADRNYEIEAVSLNYPEFIRSSQDAFYADQLLFLTYMPSKIARLVAFLPVWAFHPKQQPLGPIMYFISRQLQRLDLKWHFFSTPDQKPGTGAAFGHFLKS